MRFAELSQAVNINSFMSDLNEHFKSLAKYDFSNVENLDTGYHQIKDGYLEEYNGTEWIKKNLKLNGINANSILKVNSSGEIEALEGAQAGKVAGFKNGKPDYVTEEEAFGTFPSVNFNTPSNPPTPDEVSLVSSVSVQRTGKYLSNVVYGMTQLSLATLGFTGDKNANHYTHPNLEHLPSGGIAGQVLVNATGSGDGSWQSFGMWNISSNNFYTLADKVAIGSVNPLMHLQVKDYGGLDGNANELMIRNNLYYSSGIKAIKDGYSSQINMRNVDGKIEFKTGPNVLAGSDVSLDTRMTILNNGDVGIGTNVPGQKLDVVGNIRTNNNLVIKDGSSGQEYSFECGVDSNEDLILWDRTNGYKNIRVQDGIIVCKRDNIGGITLNPNYAKAGTHAALESVSGYDLAFYSGSTRVLTAQNNGNVGIGAVGVSNSKFYLSGNGYLQSWIGSSGVTDVKTLALYQQDDKFRFILKNNTGDSYANDAMTIFTDGKVSFGSTAASNHRVSIQALHNSEKQALRLFTTINDTNAFCEMKIDNATNDSIVMGSIGRNYSNSDWSGSSYIYSTGEDRDLYIKSGRHISFFTNGTALSNRLMTLNSNGNVGIGTNNPSYKLDVDGWARFTGTIFGDSLAVTEGGVHKYSIAYHNGGFNFAEAGVADYRLFIKDGGNVGIGTNNPTSKLDVYGDAKFGHYSANEFTMRLRNAGTSSLLKISNSVDVHSVANNDFSIVNQALDAGIGFYTKDTQIRMYIDKDGKVGIGTSNVDTFSTFQVSGYLNTDAGYRIDDQAVIKHSGTAIQIANNPNWSATILYANGNERFLIDSDSLKAEVPIKLKTYTVASLPTASTVLKGSICYVENDSIDGEVLAVCINNQWRKMVTTSIIS